MFFPSHIKKHLAVAALLAVVCVNGHAEDHESESDTHNEDSVTEVTSSQGVDFGEQGDVILQVYLRDIFLSDGLFCIMQDGELYLPLAEFTALLDFPILVDLVAGTASGWFLDPENTFSLDLSNGVVNVKNQHSDIADDDVIQDDFDLYVKYSLWQEWFPLFMDVSFSAQVMQVRSSEKLPKELARERENRKNEEDVVFAATNEYDVPAYRLLDWPEVSLSLGGFFSPESDTDSSVTNYDYRIRAIGDLAFMNGDLSLSGSQNEISNASLTLGRSNPQGLFGSSLVADFELGDTSQFLPGMIGSSLTGRGVRLGNRRLANLRDLDTIDIQGQQETDYEVELYVNDRLRGVDRDSSDNRYNFQDVALQLGQNEIRLEFYGPQGQRSTDASRTFIGSGQGRKGVLSYELAMIQPGQRVFDVFDESDDFDEIDEIDDTGSNDQLLDYNFSSALDLSYSISNRTKLGLTLASISIDDARNATQPDDGTNTNESDRFFYTNAQVVTDVSGILMSSNLTVDPDGHTAGAVSARTALGNYELGVTQRIFQKDFRDTKAINSDDNDTPIRLNTSASVYRQPFRVTGGRLSYTTGANYRLNYDNEASASVDANLDYQTSLLSLSWANAYQFSLDSGEDEIGGRVGARLRANDFTQWSLSSDWSYSDSGNRLLKSGSLRAARPFFNRGSLSLGATRDLQSEQTNYSASWGKQFPSLQLNSSIGGSSSEDIFFRIGVEITARRYPGRFLPVLSNSGGRGAVAVVVFGDENQDGKQDASEPVFEGIRLTRNRLMAGVATDKNGVAVLSGLSNNTSVDIGILETDIKHPGLKFDGIDRGVLVRAGRVPVIKVALQPATDIEGTVIIRGRNGDIPAPNVRMLLTPADGGEPLEVFTEFDGYYYLSSVPLGEYDLGPDAEQLKAAGLVIYPPTRRLILKNLDDFPPPEDFNLFRESEHDNSGEIDSNNDGIPDVIYALPPGLSAANPEPGNDDVPEADDRK